MYIYMYTNMSGTLKGPELDGNVGFKISVHLNGTSAAKPFSYDILRRISFSSISIHYDLYSTSM